MKAHGGVELEPQAFLTSALDGGEWSSSRSARFTRGGKISAFHLPTGKFYVFKHGNRGVFKCKLYEIDISREIRKLIKMLEAES
jgi:hypothetical protein